MSSIPSNAFDDHYDQRINSCWGCLRYPAATYLSLLKIFGRNWWTLHRSIPWRNGHFHANGAILSVININVLGTLTSYPFLRRLRQANTVFTNIAFSALVKSQPLNVHPKFVNVESTSQLFPLSFIIFFCNSETIFDTLRYQYERNAVVVIKHGWQSRTLHFGDHWWCNRLQFRGVEISVVHGLLFR